MDRNSDKSLPVQCILVNVYHMLEISRSGAMSVMSEKGDAKWRKG